MRPLRTPSLLVSLAILLSACNEPSSADAAEKTKLIACPEQRPQVCTMEYLPVCGQRDTGIRCVTTPCPSNEWKTYSNACSACADEKVSAYYQGECTEKD